MNYWLFKSEPGSFSIDDLAARPGQTEPWDGVRNYQARNLLRDRIQRGDRGFFYHSHCPRPAIVGLVEVASGGRPDPTAFDPAAAHYDPNSAPEAPRWYLVDVRLLRRLQRPLPLAELKGHPELAGMALLQKGNRLSVQPVGAAEWQFILSLE
jgi:predicted RNA-binding protein with PUA-like domain